MPEIVLVSEKVFQKGEASFRAAADGNAEAFRCEPAPADEVLLAAAVRATGCRGVVLGAQRYAGPLYEALHSIGGGRGAIVARFGVGHDGIDKALARQNGIVVTNTPGVLDDSVAEHAIFLLGSLARHIAQMDTNLRAGQFAAREGRELRGKRLGIVGFGRIGRRAAAIAGFGLGMNVTACGASNRDAIERREGRPIADILAENGAVEYTTDLDYLMATSDAISLHLPATDKTRHIINAARLERIKPDTLLVNTARGLVLDEIALYDFLAAGRIAGAALDVFENEPYVPVSPEKDLRMLGNVLMTPHVGSDTREANARMAAAVLANLVDFFAGRWDKLSRVA